MRDLKADLNQYKCWSGGDFVDFADQVLPEALERAIEAESTVAALAEENDIQRESIQELSARVASFGDLQAIAQEIYEWLKDGMYGESGQIKRLGQVLADLQGGDTP